MTTKMQSCVDHIKTSLDVDPWAAEMVEKIFTEYDRRFDKVLAILDEVSSDSSASGEYWNSAKTITVLRRRIIALEEGRQE